MFAKWHRASSYYRPNGERLDTYDEEEYHSNAESIGQRLDTRNNEEDNSVAGSNRERLEFHDDQKDVDEANLSDDERDNDSSAESVFLASSRRYNSLDERFKAQKPADISVEEEHEILQVIRLALQLDAVKRATASQLLEHSWFHE